MDEKDKTSTPSHEDLVGNREHAEDALFRGELPYEPQPPEPDIGLAGLYRTTRKSGSRGEELETQQSVAQTKVREILSDHQRLSRDPNAPEGSAIFSFLDSNYQSLVTEITAQCIANFELGLYRRDYPFIMNNRNPQSSDQEIREAHLLSQRSIVVETAAAVMKAMPAFIGNPDRIKETEKKDITKIVSNWGPEFTIQWFDGTIINKHFVELGMEEAEIGELMEVFTSSLRKRLAVGNINDPLAALERVKDNIDLLTDQAIAEKTGWSPEEVREVFTSGIRKYLAVNNINDPLKGVKDYIAGNISFGGRYYDDKK